MGRKKSGNSSPSGILFNKLHNHHRKRKIVLESKTIDNEKQQEQTVIDSVILDYVNKLKFYVGSEEDSFELWKATYSYRKHFIKRAVSFESVIEEFPLYKQAMGYKFIEADFKELYPEKQFMITSKWAETLPKRTVYYEEHVKDKYYRKLLISVKGITDTNSKDCIYFMLLHSILKPTHRYIIKEGELKVHRKATIQSSVSSSILHITSVNDLQHQMELRRNKSIESKTPIQPFLIVVGSDLLSLTDFYVSFGY
ncbi:PREDICTED: uncharacterized protein LOC108371451 isoform X1 [Rhagoletis zephyria]|uniref:uncharacterized protein LOC108371451 isoform X1 n=1 Tax=Rhagoletis zephyria TaxID=28612 RepID=UPI0008112A30|nr:PREDICTED: uncharacterized protein LOC108371451 isoform X1 [Rhagoletis zephyria]XP_036319756.1 uncharacterized protein LOC118734149 isoform X1 [Rhagoletis pomonella]